MGLRLSINHLGTNLLLGLLTAQTERPAITKTHTLLLRILKRLDRLECDSVTHAEDLAAVCLDDDEVQIREIKQIDAPGLELDNVERPRDGDGGERGVLAEIVEVGLGCIRGASLGLLG